MLHLQRFKRAKKEYEAPTDITQTGVAAYLGIHRGNVPRLIKKLRDEGLLGEKAAHVEGAKRSIKVYFLTETGFARAYKIRDFVKEKRVVVREVDSTLKETTMEELSTVTGLAIPLSEAVRHIRGGILDIASLTRAPDAEKPVSEDEVSVKFFQRPIDPKHLFQSRFVGREGEIDQLREHIDRIISKKGGTVFISGEAGVGKTRLVGEMYRYARKRGICFLKGGCLAEKEIEPYIPFIEALKGAIGERETYEKLRFEIDSIKAAFPGLARLLSPAGPGFEKKEESPILDDSDPKGGRERLFEALFHIISSLAEKSPLVLFIDDLHWADSASLNLLYYLARNTDKTGILLCGAFRPEEVQVHKTLPDILSRMERERLCAHISLDRLDKAHTEAMIDGLFPENDFPPDFYGIIHRETDGNPFFIEETLKALAESETILKDSGRWKLAGDLTSLPVPGSITSVITSRLSKLDGASRDVLNVAATIGQRFDFDTLAAASGFVEADVLGHLDKLADAHLVSESMESEAILYEFNHAKIREVVYSGLSRMKRRAIHRKVGEALESIYEGELSEAVNDLAYHFFEAKDGEKTLEYASFAGARAAELFAADEAKTYFKMALEATTDTTDKQALKVDLLLSLGDCFDILGEWDCALASFKEAEELAEALDDSFKLAESLRKTAVLLSLRSQWDEALECSGRALETSDVTGDKFGAAASYIQQANIHLRKSDYVESAENAEMSLKISRECGYLSLEAENYRLLGIISQETGKLDEAIDYCERSIPLLETLQDKYGQVKAFNSLGVMLTEKGTLEKALEYYERCIALSKETHFLRGQAYSLRNSGHIYGRTGKYERAEASCQKALELFERLQEKFGVAAVHSAFGVIYWKKKDWEKSKEHFERAAGLFEEIDAQTLLAEVYHDLGRMSVERDKKNAAVEYMEKSRKVYDELNIEKKVEELKKDIKELKGEK